MYAIGVDIGTTGTKATVIDSEGKTICVSYQGYDLFKKPNGFVGQSADDWWNTLVFTVTDCVSKLENPDDVAVVSLSTQGGSLVCADENGAPLDSAMVWMDSRSKAQYRELLNLYGEDYYYNITGHKLNAGLNLCKIKWLSDEDSSLFRKTHKFLSTVDYVNFKLTGEYCIDPSNAAMTQLYDIKNNRWSRELLDILSVDESRLPAIKKSGEQIGTLTKEAAKTLGLSPGVKVISGGHDQYCAALGCGAINPGQAMISAGTAFAILYITAGPVFNTDTYIAPGPHLIDGLWGNLATVPTAGVCMEWFKNNFAASESFEDIDRHAQSSDCESLFFYPYFSGSAFPDNSISAKACVMGLSLEHTGYHIARAIMEGVAFQLRYALEKFDKPSSVKLMGGACKSRLWSGILTDVLPYDLYKAPDNNAAPYGAAVNAGLAVGMFKDLNKLNSGRQIIPKEENAVCRYNEKYEKYKTGIKSVIDFFD